MKTIDIPGFTAESSLGKSGTQYVTTVNGLIGASSDIQPQLRNNRPNGPGGCIPGCLCVIAEGCPCCTSLDTPPWGPTQSPFNPWDHPRPWNLV